MYGAGHEEGRAAEEGPGHHLVSGGWCGCGDWGRAAEKMVCGASLPRALYQVGPLPAGSPATRGALGASSVLQHIMRTDFIVTSNNNVIQVIRVLTLHIGLWMRALVWSLTRGVGAGVSWT